MALNEANAPESFPMAVRLAATMTLRDMLLL
jgi:hypothetical protein